MALPGPGCTLNGNDVLTALPLGGSTDTVPVSDVVAQAISAAAAALLGGAGVEGDTLAKLLGLYQGLGRAQRRVPDIAARDALTDTLADDRLWVDDDGDGKWATYMALTPYDAGPPVVAPVWVKTNDQDIVETVLTGLALAPNDVLLPGAADDLQHIVSSLLLKDYVASQLATLDTLRVDFGAALPVTTGYDEGDLFTINAGADRGKTYEIAGGVWALVFDPLTAWVDSVDGALVESGSSTLIAQGHTIALVEAAGNTYQFAPATGTWSTLAGKFSSPTWTIGQGQTMPAAYESIELVAQPLAMNWRIVPSGSGPTELAEAWHDVGAAGEPAFQNGWTNFGSSFQALRFRRRGRRVDIEGLVKSGATGFTSAATVFTLPVGFRPQGMLLISTVANNAAARSDVSPGGEVRASSGSNAFFSLTFSIALD